jgi:hypothetical protein
MRIGEIEVVGSAQDRSIRISADYGITRGLIRLLTLH